MIDANLWNEAFAGSVLLRYQLSLQVMVLRVRIVLIRADAVRRHRDCVGRNQR